MVEAYPIGMQPRSQRFEFFRGVVDKVFCPMNIEAGANGQSFAGSLCVADLRQMRLAHVASSACVVRRRPEDIARISAPGYLVKFQLRGQSICTQRGREVHLRPGDFVICSTQEPYSLHFHGPYSMPVIGLSEQAMHDLTPDPDQFLGIRMQGEDADCGLLSGFVSQVVARMDHLAEPILSRAEANILDLLGAVLSSRARNRPLSTAQQLQAIKSYVRAHLNDSGLGPAMIAAHFGISVRYVHVLFRGEPLTVGRHIRHARLLACRRALEENPALKSLTDFALAWGFYDLSHMSRCFREEFQLSPTEIRRRAATGLGQDALLA